VLHLGVGRLVISKGYKIKVKLVLFLTDNTDKDTDFTGSLSVDFVLISVQICEKSKKNVTSVKLPASNGKNRVTGFLFLVSG
jgi:hypothetical protein